MKIPFFWCDMNNFGDALNPIIFKRLIGVDIKPVSFENAEFIGIGSLLDMCLMDSHDKKFMKKPLFVFSTGIGFEEGGFFHNPYILLPERLKRNMHCFALRGKLTDARMEKMLGHKTGAVIGDGGLLVSKLIDKSKIKPKYDLGIVPHFADKNNPVFKKIHKNIKNSVILDPTVSVDEFLHNLCECRAVISTAMHPLIACDSLRIPNLWVRISEETTSRYKFHDYYSVFNKHKEPFDLLNNDFTEDTLKMVSKKYDISDKDVAKVQEDLMSAVYKVKGQIRKLRAQIFIKRIRDFCVRFLCLFVPVKKLRRKIRNYLMS